MYYHVHIKKRQFIVLSLCMLLIPLFAFLYTKAADSYPIYFLPCGLKTYFHLYCPGCGGTHAVDALLHLRLIESFFYNPLVLYMAACVVYYWVKFTICLVRQHGDARFNIYLGSLWGLLFFLILYTILRNVALVSFGMDYLGELSQYWQ